MEQIFTEQLSSVKSRSYHWFPAVNKAEKGPALADFTLQVREENKQTHTREKCQMETKCLERPDVIEQDRGTMLNRAARGGLSKQVRLKVSRWACAAVSSRRVRPREKAHQKGRNSAS